MVSRETEQFIDILLPEHRDRRQIFPPPGPEFDRAKDAIENILIIKWPSVIDESEVFFKGQEISATALEFVDITLDGELTLSDSFEDRELLLTDLEEDIKARAITAGEELKSGVIATNKNKERERRKALLELQLGGEQIHDARMLAAIAIWHITDGVNENKRKYLRNSRSLPPELRLLILTAQNYLVWTTFSDRKGYVGDEFPNIWEKLIEMYQKGMLSYHINPEANDFTFSLVQKKAGETPRQIDYTIDYPGTFNPESFDL